MISELMKSWEQRAAMLRGEVIRQQEEQSAQKMGELEKNLQRQGHELRDEVLQRQTAYQEEVEALQHQLRDIMVSKLDL